MDLSDRPITDGSADGSHVYLQEEVAEGGIRRKSLEMNEWALASTGDGAGQNDTNPGGPRSYLRCRTLPQALSTRRGCGHRDASGIALL
jgi:hypothetical protein